jgi:hypothetical protein
LSRLVTLLLIEWSLVRIQPGEPIQDFHSDFSYFFRLIVKPRYGPPAAEA